MSTSERRGTMKAAPIEFAYPLKWPDGVPRVSGPSTSRFDVTPFAAQQQLGWEIERMRGRYVVISTNIPTRQDGKGFYAGAKPVGGDTGVAVYFERDGKQMVFACDKWDRPEDNMRAIQKTIEAIRGIERWGASDMMERALAAFEALPAPKSCWDILGVRKGAAADEIDAAWRKLAAEHHPDRGGSTVRMAEINQARADAKSVIAT